MSSGRHNRPWSTQDVSPMLPPRWRNCLREHTSCWPQSERSGDSNRTGRQGIQDLRRLPLIGPRTFDQHSMCWRRRG